MNITRSLLVAGTFGILGSSALTAQDIGYPTAEEYAEIASKAEAAPLFASDEPLRFVLRADIDWLRDERSDSVETEGTLTLLDASGAESVLPVDVRARGNFRRSKRNCNFPPLRLDFPTKEMEGTVFEGQDKLKLVTPCHDSRDDFQRYVLREYLVYQTFQQVTPTGFRARLVEITYEDTSEEYETRTKYGFLIESEEQMAERNRATFQEVNQFHPARADGPYAVQVALFSYMIGNTDWSPVFFHNVKLIRTEEAQYLTVPYDFDFSGAVNARYAAPDPSLSIRRVTERIYRGFCRDELQHEAAAAPFLENRQAIFDLVNDFELLREEDREDMVEFYEDFYEVLEDEGKFEREIARVCRKW